MGGRPITCPCRRGGEGSFLLAACVFAAIRSRVLRPPDALSLAFAVWLGVAGNGLSLTVIGIRALLREGDPAQMALTHVS